MNIKATYAICMTLLGCGLNNIFLEYIIRLDPGAGHLITFSQFLFVAVHGYIFTSKFGTTEAKIPPKAYLILVTLFFLTSVINNWAFNFNIPVPLHMIFRAGSLIANMIMGMIILKKRYTISKILSVIMISAGIAICTLISSNKIKPSCAGCDDLQNQEPSGEDDSEYLFWWLIGISLLTTALFLSARMGIFQEEIYGKYGKHPTEALYYTAMLSYLNSMRVLVVNAKMLRSKIQ